MLETKKNVINGESNEFKFISFKMIHGKTVLYRSLRFTPMIAVFYRETHCTNLKTISYRVSSYFRYL